MDNLASLVTQYPSGFCFCDTTTPLQSPLWVFMKSDATMQMEYNIHYFKGAKSKFGIHLFKYLIYLPSYLYESANHKKC